MDRIVSIVMPAFNTEKYVTEAIESVLNQSFENWELIAVDDGSSDNTGEILNHYSRVDTRIRVTRITRSSVSHARNVALDMACGNWIFFMDSDDILPKAALEKLVGNADDNDIVIGDFGFYPQIKEKYRLKDKCYFNVEEIKPDFPELFVGSYFSTVWGKLFRRDFIKERFDETYKASEDVLFMSEIIASVGKMRTISDEVYKYRENADSITHMWLEYGYHPMKTEAIINHFLEFLGETVSARNLMYSYYIHHIELYVEEVADCATLDREQKANLICELFHGRYFKEIPLGRYNLPAKELRRWMVLKTEDIGLIIPEFSK